MLHTHACALARMLAHARTHTHARMHTHTHTHTHACTRTHNKANKLKRLSRQPLSGDTTVIMCSHYGLSERRREKNGGVCVKHTFQCVKHTHTESKSGKSSLKRLNRPITSNVKMDQHNRIDYLCSLLNERPVITSIIICK